MMRCGMDCFLLLLRLLVRLNCQLLLFLARLWVVVLCNIRLGRDYGRH